jgi:hypothetical protein
LHVYLFCIVITLCLEEEILPFFSKDSALMLFKYDTLINLLSLEFDKISCQHNTRELIMQQY